MDLAAEGIHMFGFEAADGTAGGRTMSCAMHCNIRSKKAGGGGARCDGWCTVDHHGVAPSSSPSASSLLLLLTHRSMSSAWAPRWFGSPAAATFRLLFCIRAGGDNSGGAAVAGGIRLRMRPGVVCSVKSIGIGSPLSAR